MFFQLSSTFKPFRIIASHNTMYHKSWNNKMKCTAYLFCLSQLIAMNKTLTTTLTRQFSRVVLVIFIHIKLDNCTLHALIIFFSLLSFLVCTSKPYNDCCTFRNKTVIRHKIAQFVTWSSILETRGELVQVWWNTTNQGYILFDCGRCISISHSPFVKQLEMPARSDAKQLLLELDL